jgi:hypothetical protein
MKKKFLEKKIAKIAKNIRKKCWVLVFKYRGVLVSNWVLVFKRRGISFQVGLPHILFSSDHLQTDGRFLYSSKSDKWLLLQLRYKWRYHKHLIILDCLYDTELSWSPQAKQDPLHPHLILFLLPLLSSNEWITWVTIIQRQHANKHSRIRPNVISPCIA